VMEFIVSISRPGKSWNLSEGHRKSWKSSKLSQKIFQKLKKITDKSKTGFNFSRNRHKHTFYALQCRKIC